VVYQVHSVSLMSQSVPEYEGIICTPILFLLHRAIPSVELEQTQNSKIHTSSFGTKYSAEAYDQFEDK
jgi:hypothetical protein